VLKELLRLECLNNAGGYHTSARIVAYGGGGFIIGTPASRFDKQRETEGVGARVWMDAAAEGVWDSRHTEGAISE